VVQGKRHSLYCVSAYIEQQNKQSNAELVDYFTVRRKGDMSTIKEQEQNN
jgi:hypothetical protein